MLMHASRWTALHGYPEITTSGHSDGFLCIAAAASGLRQVILPAPVYHQEHVRAVDWTDLSTATRPVTDYAEFDSAAREMLAARRPLVVNGNAWGLGGEDLPESLIAAV
jgi:hypothetical protein